jgi:hypothetical protein
MMSQDSSVGIAMHYRLVSRGLIPRKGKRLFLLCSVHTGSEAHPASYTMGTRGLFPQRCCGWGVKLSIHFYLVLIPRIVAVYLYSPVSSWCRA